MKVTCTSDIARKLIDIHDNSEPAAKKRAAYRNLLTEEYNTKAKSGGHWDAVPSMIANHVTASKFNSDNGGHKTLKPIFSNLRDQLNPSILVSIIATQDWCLVLEAVLSPDNCKTDGAAAVFGWPKAYDKASIDQMWVDLRTLAGPAPMAVAPATPAPVTPSTVILNPTELVNAVSTLVGKTIEADGGSPDTELTLKSIEKVLDIVKPHLTKDNNEHLNAYFELCKRADRFPEMTGLELSERAQTFVDAISALNASVFGVESEEVVPDITIDASLEEAVNQLLKAATRGKLPSINDILVSQKKAQQTVADLEEKLAKAIERAKGSTIMAQPYKIEGDGTIPEGDLVWKTADTVFKGIKGVSAPLAKVKVPVWQWKGEHPNVPAIDPNYRFRFKPLLKVLWALVNNKKTFMHGHTGTGKSTLAEQVAAHLQWPMMRVNLDSNIERSDMTGSHVLREKGGVTVSEFVEGVLPKAMQGPYILLLDELDFGRPDVMYVIQRALEDKGLLLTEDGGRLIMPHPYFRFIATANTRGQGDEYGCYQGARPQSLALLNRFTAWLEVDYLERDDEIQLLQDTVIGLDKPMATNIVRFGNELREAFTAGETSITATPRSLITMGQGYVDMKGVMPTENEAVRIAFDMAILDQATADSRQRVIELFNRCFK